MTIQAEKFRPEFVDEQMGLPVVLLDSAYEAQSGNASGVVIPDEAGLEATMAMARVMDDHKLNGGEIKFLRRAIGIKATELADFLDVVPETLSRWENGKEPISINAERVLRMKVYHALKRKVHGVKASAEAILGMKFRFRLAGDGMMIFRTALVVVGEDNELAPTWVYQGVRNATDHKS